MITIGMIIFVVGLFLLIVCLTGDEYGASDIVGVVALFALVAAVTGLVIAIIGADKRDDRDARERHHVEKAIGDACFPRVVTHKSRSGDTVTFDCANDGELRVYKVK